jgi:hypothetical protein
VLSLRLRQKGAGTPEVYLRGKRVRLDPAKSVGKGGEADVFDVGGGKAIKVWKAPDHPDYAGMAAEQDAARARIAEHQQKLRAFPRGLPGRVVAPEELATDQSGQRVTGYTMGLIRGAEVLLRYGEPSFHGLVARATRILSDLHGTVSALHAAGVVIGDFNDLNVLVKEEEAFLIDADSVQFGPFLCRVFTERFVDPLLCDPKLPRPVLARPYTPGSDWYAFAVMVMQCLLSAGPYGGVFKPKSPAARIPESARPRHRITVFHPEVAYTKPATPYRALPDDVLHALYQIFHEDRRDAFPRRLLDELNWSTCAACGATHARAACPFCAATPSASIKEAVAVRGEVTCERIFHTRGSILAAAMQGGELRFLALEGGELRREDGAVALRGAVDPFTRFAIQGQTTLVGRGNQVMALSPRTAPARLLTDCLDNRPLFAANARFRYWTEGGRLLRNGGLGSMPASLVGEAPELCVEPMGDVLAGQTRFWVGERFGFGFYRADRLAVAFVFDAERPGLKDTVRLPSLGGQLIDASAVFDEQRAWVFLAAQRSGRTAHQCVVVAADGEVLAVAEGEANDGTWLGTLRGQCAVGGALLVPTDAGVVRVEVKQGAITETRRFPETEPFVTHACQLFAGQRGLFVVDTREIRALRLSGSRP